MDLEDFISISRYAGMREDLVQAGGGNSSVKIDGETMLIKSTGVALGSVTEKSGWSKVNYARLADFLRHHKEESFPVGTGPSLLMENLEAGGRPSVETFMHSLTAKFTLHTHPILVNVLTSCRGGWEELQQLFPEGVFVGYDTPGLPLAQRFCRQWGSGEALAHPPVFLKNHGLIVSAPTAEAVIAETERIEERAARYLGVDHTPYVETTALYRKLRAWQILKKENLLFLSTDTIIEEACRRFGEKGWPLAISPDGLSYCGRSLCVVTDGTTGESMKRFRDRYGIPTVFFYHGHIYLAGPDFHRAKDIESTLRYCAAIAVWGQGRGGEPIPEVEG